VGHWAVLPDWLISLNINSAFSQKYKSASFLEMPVHLVNQEWEKFDKPITDVAPYELSTDLQYVSFPITRIPHPWVWLKSADGTRRVIRVAPDENGVRAWCVKALDVLGWMNPADDVCAQPGLWTADKDDFLQLETYLGAEFSFRPPSDFCFLNWGEAEAHDRAFSFFCHWNYDF
jgi:hypothetical protein